MKENVKNCPICGQVTEVKDVRKSGRGLYRRRHCTKCNETYTTKEIMDDEYKYLLKCAESVDVLRNILTLKEIVEGTGIRRRKPPKTLGNSEGFSSS